MHAFARAVCLCLVTACGAGEDADAGTGTSGGPSTSTSTSTGAAGSTTGTDPQATSDSGDEPTSAPVGPGYCGDGIVDEDESCDLGAGNVDHGDCTSVCRFGVCGDGLVHGGYEECDDGNPFNTDGCLVECLLPRCGDGYRGPGEACDDGNEIDDDDCPNSCSKGGCGDGFVQVGEACDDGNTSNTDGCLNTCEPASCGDNLIHVGVEACDDGNNSDDDTCTNTCVAPSCSDGAENGFETDVDCGGVYCEGCSLGAGCVSNLDCGDGICKQGVCGVPAPLMAPDCASADVGLEQMWSSIHPACGCHGNGAGGLGFNNAASFRDNTVGVFAKTAAMPLIEADDIGNSYVLFKVLNQQNNVVGGRGSRMPIAKALSAAQTCTLINWVKSGAD